MSRGFSIRRVSTLGELGDPLGLEFVPPKGSDELHEALKQAYPFETNLQSRMRQAVIEFLLAEQQAEAELQTPLSANQHSPEYLPSPQSSFVSTLPSPCTSGIAPSQSQSGSSASRRTSSLPSQQELMDVWTLPSKPQAKIHTRRNMTSEEKKAYKQKRLIGACADCKRRRRKCDHDPSNSIPQSSGRRGAKQRKRSPVSSNVSSAPDPPATEDVFSSFTSDFNASAAMPVSFAEDMSLFDGSTNLDFESSGLDYDLGFDAHSDWPLFPELSSAPMDFDWLSSSNPGFDVHGTSSSITSGFNDWPTSHLDQLAANVPLTPQSLLMTPMSRTQSDNSSRGLGLGFADNSVDAMPSAFYPSSQPYAETAAYLERTDQRTGDGGFALPSPQSANTQSPSELVSPDQQVFTRTPYSQSHTLPAPDDRFTQTATTEGSLQSPTGSYATQSAGDIQSPQEGTQLFSSLHAAARNRRGGTWDHGPVQPLTTSIASLESAIDTVNTNHVMATQLATPGASPQRYSSEFKDPADTPGAARLQQQDMSRNGSGLPLGGHGSVSLPQSSVSRPSESQSYYSTEQQQQHSSVITFTMPSASLATISPTENVDTYTQREVSIHQTRHMATQCELCDHEEKQGGSPSVRGRRERLRKPAEILILHNQHAQVQEQSHANLGTARTVRQELSFSIAQPPTSSNVYSDNLLQTLAPTGYTQGFTWSSPTLRIPVTISLLYLTLTAFGTSLQSSRSIGKPDALSALLGYITVGIMMSALMITIAETIPESKHTIDSLSNSHQTWRPNFNPSVRRLASWLLPVAFLVANVACYFPSFSSIITKRSSTWRSRRSAKIILELASIELKDRHYDVSASPRSNQGANYPRANRTSPSTSIPDLFRRTVCRLTAGLEKVKLPSSRIC